MIYIVKHKPYDCPVMEGYKELYVGDMYQGTNKVNQYNPYINETTAMWDIYDSGDDIVGLVHYRRRLEGITFDKAKEILTEYDVITTANHEPKTPYDHLYYLNQDLVAKYVSKLPIEIQEWFHEHHPFNVCNMFVAKREFLKGYLDLIEPLLPLVEQFIKEDKTTNIRQNRLLGYIFEILFGYYCGSFTKYYTEIEELE